MAALHVPPLNRRCGALRRAFFQILRQQQLGVVHLGGLQLSVAAD
jgi:hypothetical protein